jgi:hypothetical protein
VDANNTHVISRNKAGVEYNRSMYRSLLAALLLVFPAALWAAEFQIDHATVAGNDIKKLQASLAAIGVPSVYGGAHSNKTTEMALVSMHDGSYLELMGLQPGASPQNVDQHVWAPFLKANAGPCAWAMRAKDIAGELARLKAAGIPSGAAVRSGRDRPDGVHLEWETSDIGSGVRGAFFPFLIHDITPRDQRAFPQGKAGVKEFRGVTHVVIAVRNLDDAIARYRQAWNLPASIKQVDKEFGAHLAVVGGLPVILAQPLTADSWLAQRLEKFGEAPCAFVIGVSTPGRFHGVSKTRWFGIDISWFDPEALGWRLGFENSIE